MWLTKAHTSQEAPTSTSGSCSLIYGTIIEVKTEKLLKKDDNKSI